MPWQAAAIFIGDNVHQYYSPDLLHCGLLLCVWSQVLQLQMSRDSRSSSLPLNLARSAVSHCGLLSRSAATSGNPASEQALRRVSLDGYAYMSRVTARAA